MMRGGNATIGTWLQFPSADVAEVMGASGYDWVAVDMEHGAFTRAILPDVFRAIERGGSTPFARIAQAELRPIKDALDSGAQGLVFPMIESREQLDRAISLSLYPDAGGSRGVGYSRANMYGRDFDPYRVDVAKDILLVAQIEHIRAVEQLDAILSHPRLDAIMVGPYDLSGSMGLTGQFDHPDFVAVMARINEACKRHNMPMGNHVVRHRRGVPPPRLRLPETLKNWGGEGNPLKRASLPCPRPHPFPPKLFGFGTGNRQGNVHENRFLRRFRLFGIARMRQAFRCGP